MRIVVALGGNALLRRSDPMTTAVQRRNIRIAAQALAPLAAEHSLIVVHGNGPQVGLLSLQAESYRGAEPYPLDVLDAGTQGMIGYLVQQELRRVLPPDRPVVTVLTMITVDPDDPAFTNPTKFVGPTYSQADADALAQGQGLGIPARTARRGAAWCPPPSRNRSSRSSRSPGCSSAGSVVVCAGGGGIPTMRSSTAAGELSGVEAVIDKDLAGELLSENVGADLFVMATDVDGVYLDWGTPAQRRLGEVTPEDLIGREFPAGSMGPKVDAAVRFVAKTGRRAAIGSLADIPGIVAGTAGTNIVPRTRADEPRTRHKAGGGRGAASVVSNHRPGYPDRPNGRMCPRPAHSHIVVAAGDRYRTASPRQAAIGEVVDMTTHDRLTSICRCGRRHSSGSAPWWAPASSRCSARRVRWPVPRCGSPSSSPARSPGCRATRSPSSAPATPPAAGLFEYLRRGFGEGHLTGVTAWLTYVTNAIITAMVAVSFGSYASALFTHGNPTWAKIFAALILVVMTGVNIVGSQLVAKAQTVIVYVVLGILVLFAIVTLATLKPALLAPSGYPPLRDIIASVALTFFAFLGFGIITFTAKDLREPSRQLPRAMTLALVHRHRHLRRHRTRRVRHPARPGGDRLRRDRARRGRPAHPR